MRKLISLFMDFRDYLRIRRMNESLPLTEKDKIILRGYDKEFEKHINKVLIGRLATEMIDGAITPDIQRGAQLAMAWRISLLGNLTKKD